MNEIVNKFSLAGDKFMPEMHLKQPEFSYSACGSFTNNKERIQKFKETGDTNYISIKTKNELDKVSFQHDTAYGDFRYLAKRTASDKVLRNKAFNIAKTPKYDRYQRGIASMIYKFFDKKFAGSGVNMHANNEKVAEELHKPIVTRFKKRIIYSGFKDNIWYADLADMQLISKFDKGFRFFLCAIDIFSKYTCVVSLKVKKGVSIVNAFQKVRLANQTKYGWTKEVNFTIDLLKNG